ncbi:MAG: DNA cytosine methyltransferase, partial [Desulfovibrio sp.]|nr:DNA cytosine methyltransferase [Desulfovibrio sp.]
MDRETGYSLFTRATLEAYSEARFAGKEGAGGKRDSSPTQASFTFIDLFAGIGGIRLGFEAAGGECVFSSEIDK